MELQAENLQQTKMSQNTSLKLVIKLQEKETKEERKTIDNTPPQSYKKLY